jgi:DNA-binding transcriptional regulator YhcF (GntR family)
MRFWISRNSEVPLRDQLTTQILLAITSKSIEPGEKLPSTRALARRLGVHSNTVNAAYRDLAKRGWVEFRKGSGVYVRAFDKDRMMEADLELDRLIAMFIGTARDKGYSLSKIRSQVKHWLELQPPDHFVVIEEDPELRRILEYEIGISTGFPVSAMGLDECGEPSALVGAAPVALYGKADAVRGALPKDCECQWLESRSVHEELQKLLRSPSDDAFIIVVSRWSDFRRWARTILLAAGLDSDIIHLQDASMPEWKESLRLATFVVTDSLVGAQLPAKYRSRSFVFSVIAQSSLIDLKRLAKELTTP